MNRETTRLRRRCATVDYLRWYTAYGRLDFEFPNGHPFSPDPQPITSPGFGNTVRVVFADPIQTKYNVVLTDSASTEHRVDPKVIIDNGTQDFGASRRSSIFSTILKVGLVAAAIAYWRVVVSAISSEDTRD